MDIDNSSDDEIRNGGQTGSSNKEELECDLSAYVLFHEGNTGAPCLSFDIIRDDLGDVRDCETPLTCYFIAGTQAIRAHQNNIVLIKMSNLHKVNQDEDSEDESDDEEDHEPVIKSALVPHDGPVNRIRATSFQNKNLAASWSESSSVHIWDLDPLLEAVNDTDAMMRFKNNQKPTPLFTFNGHKEEGFAIDWSPTMPGTLASGDCTRNIYIWRPAEGGRWVVDSKPYASHTASVEDIQWSPNEQHVFASCSVDRSIKIWDSRGAPKKGCMLSCDKAHKDDINVIHWNRNDPFLASGGDDSKILVWDLRKFETKTPVAELQYHSGPICTVEWHCSDSSVLASGSEDNCILQWDLAVEKEKGEEEEEDDHPQQLLFVHQGQKEVKEVHWHPQVPGLMISTALSGFNIFKTISC